MSENREYTKRLFSAFVGYTPRDLKTADVFRFQAVEWLAFEFPALQSPCSLVAPVMFILVTETGLYPHIIYSLYASSLSAWVHDCSLLPYSYILQNFVFSNWLCFPTKYVLLLNNDVDFLKTTFTIIADVNQSLFATNLSDFLLNDQQEVLTDVIFTSAL